MGQYQWLCSLVHRMWFHDALYRVYCPHQMPYTYSRSFDGVGGYLHSDLWRSGVSDPCAPKGGAEPFIGVGIIGGCPRG